MSKFHDYDLNILISYAYYTKEIDEYLSSLDINVKLVMDSGAFTVWKKGKNIELKDYCKFLRSIKTKPWRYFNLDVIGNPEKTNENYELMLKEGFNPVPIFTRGENIEMLDRYYETSDVVALGGLVATKGNKDQVKRMMKLIGDRKVHWLGYANFNCMKYYKPYMCDSSAVTTFRRFGGGTVYLGNGKTVNMCRKLFVKKPDKEIRKTFEKWEIFWEKFSKKENWNIKELDLVGFTSYINLMFDVKKNLGTNIFLALATLRECKTAVQQFKKLQKIL